MHPSLTRRTPKTPDPLNITFLMTSHLTSREVPMVPFKYLCNPMAVMRLLELYNSL